MVKRAELYCFRFLLWLSGSENPSRSGRSGPQDTICNGTALKITSFVSFCMCLFALSEFYYKAVVNKLNAQLYPGQSPNACAMNQSEQQAKSCSGSQITIIGRFYTDRRKQHVLPPENNIFGFESQVIDMTLVHVVDFVPGCDHMVLENVVN